MCDYNNSWYSKPGNQNDIVLYTKVSIARNVSGFLFPSKISIEDSAKLLSLIFSYMEDTSLHEQFSCINLKQLDPLGRKLLEERGSLTSKLSGQVEQGMIVHNNGALYINVNTEDHININSFVSGFDLDTSYFIADNIETEMQKKISFVAKEDIGFISSDLMRIGSGIKFSVLCSLPGLLYSKKIPLVAELARSADLVVSGYYSESSKESLGALFSISTGVSVGGNVQSQMTEFRLVIEKIIKMEKEARASYVKENLVKTEDMVGRAFAISEKAKMITYKETVDIIFKIKFGLTVGLLNGISHEQCNALLFNSQVGHLASSLLNGHLGYNYNIIEDLSEPSLEEYRARMLHKECEKIKIRF